MTSVSQRPVVFFDINIGETPAGRIKMELFNDVVPKCVPRSHPSLAFGFGFVLAARFCFELEVLCFCDLCFVFLCLGVAPWVCFPFMHNFVRD